jgi:hypothetical protein
MNFVSIISAPPHQMKNRSVLPNDIYQNNSCRATQSTEKEVPPR